MEPNAKFQCKTAKVEKREIEHESTIKTSVYILIGYTSVNAVSICMPMRLCVRKFPLIIGACALNRVVQILNRKMIDLKGSANFFLLSDNFRTFSNI